MMHRPMRREPRAQNMTGEGVGAARVKKMTGGEEVLDNKEGEEVALGERQTMLSSKLTATPETMITSPYLETEGGVAAMMVVEEVSTMMISIETDIRGVTSWSWLKGGRAIRMNRSIFLVSNYLARYLLSFSFILY